MMQRDLENLKLINKKKKFLCDKVEDKITGEDGASSRALQKEFYDN